MPKIHIVVGINNYVHAACIDLAELPTGATDTLAAHPWRQANEIMDWLLQDTQRAAALTDEISSGNLTTESLNFISDLASFWENLPPSETGATSLVFMALPGRSNFIRTSDEAAQNIQERALLFNNGQPS